jgi:hypothetical protein
VVAFVGLSGSSGYEPCRKTATVTSHAPRERVSSAVATGDAEAAVWPRTSLAWPAPRSTGIDLEIRILHVSIEFPWLKALPISLGQRIVISLMAKEDTQEDGPTGP